MDFLFTTFDRENRYKNNPKRAFLPINKILMRCTPKTNLLTWYDDVSLEGVAIRVVKVGFLFAQLIKEIRCFLLLKSSKKYSQKKTTREDVDKVVFIIDFLLSLYLIFQKLSKRFESFKKWNKYSVTMKLILSKSKELTLIFDKRNKLLILKYFSLVLLTLVEVLILIQLNTQRF